jgi:hypothetical protein
VEVAATHLRRVSVAFWISASSQGARQVRGRLLAVEVMVGLRKLRLPSLDFSAARKMIGAAGTAIGRHELGYALITAAEVSGYRP